MENKQHVSDVGSTETVKCSVDIGKSGQKIAWFHVRTGEKVKSGERFELTGKSLKIASVQLVDAGTYECRLGSSRQYLTIYVNGEFSLCSCCSSFQHYIFFHLAITLTCCCCC